MSRDGSGLGGQLNKFDDLARVYLETDKKPDKLYSIVPTLLELVGDVRGKAVLDLGCGAGNVSRKLAALGPSLVIGLDNSKAQLALASKEPRPNLEYRKADVFVDDLPNGDIAVAMFILNYSPNIQELGHLLRKIYDSLTLGGKLIAVVDMPSDHDLTRFGAKKRVEKPGGDGSPMTIKLYNKGKAICHLNAFYYTRQTIARLARQAGFKSVQWKKPIITKAGIRKFGEAFWSGYLGKSELGYLRCVK